MPDTPKTHAGTRGGRGAGESLSLVHLERMRRSLPTSSPIVPRFGRNTRFPNTPASASCDARILGDSSRGGQGGGIFGGPREGERE